MKTIRMVLCVALALLAWPLAAAEFRIIGGNQLVISSTAEQSVWTVARDDGGNPLAVLSWVESGKLHVQTFPLPFFGDIEPGPDPDPDPEPEPGPGPVETMFGVLVEETDDRDTLPPEVVKAIMSEKVRNYMDENGHQFRVVDKDIKDPDGKIPADIASFLQRAKGKDLPWLILADQDGSILYEGPVTGEDELIDTLKNYGGE